MWDLGVLGRILVVCWREGEAVVLGALRESVHVVWAMIGVEGE